MTAMQDTNPALDSSDDAYDTEPGDLDIILPEGNEVTIDGIRAEVRRLRTREFLALMRVITRGLGEGLGSVKLNTDDPEQMQADLIGLMLVAVPNAAAEFGEFCMQIVEPVSQTDRAALALSMENPDPMEMLDVVGVVAMQEKDDLVALAGKARAWLVKIQHVYRKTGTTPG